MGQPQHGGSDAVEELSIEALQQQLDAGSFTCQAAVDAYLDRIARWDGAGPELKAILAVNPHARDWAASYDKDAARQAAKPLRGVSVVVKDNGNTVDMPTTGGCLALKGVVPARNSTVVQKLIDAGALILAKANLHEFALAGLTVSSLGGQTLNPYDLTRTPGGSSGGSGVAVSMSFATVGIGTDTVNSVRSPSSANCIVGLRPSRGLISRAGFIPVSSTQDIVGPMGRTVADVARMLDVMAGYDPADPVTARCIGRVPSSYRQGMQATDLRGKRIGILRSLQGSGPDCEAVNGAVEASIEAMRDAGADVVSLDDFQVDADDLIANLDVQPWEFKGLLERYLQALPHPPLRTLAQLLDGGQFHPSLNEFLRQAQAVGNPDDDPAYLKRRLAMGRLADRVFQCMADQRLDAFAYPLQKCLVVPVGSASQHGRNGILAALLGFPTVTLPMGFSAPTRDAPIGVPMGLDLMARPFHEPLLLDIAHVLEQSMRVRRPASREQWPM